MSEPCAAEPQSVEPQSVEPAPVDTPPIDTAPIDTDGGDAACWANRVCPECGRLNEAERPEICEACGAEFG